MRAEQSDQKYSCNKSGSSDALSGITRNNEHSPCFRNSNSKACARTALIANDNRDESPAMDDWKYAL
jgi:hypothetical protein